MKQYTNLKQKDRKEYKINTEYFKQYLCASQK